MTRSSPPEHCTTTQAVRVRFGETDLMGIVHHATYLLYFEVARVEYLRRRAAVATEWAARGLHLPVVEATLRYARTAAFDDLLLVEARLGELLGASLRFDYRILREDALVCSGSTRLACVGNDHRPRRIPPDVTELLLGPERVLRPTDLV